MSKVKSISVGMLKSTSMRSLVSPVSFTLSRRGSHRQAALHAHVATDTGRDGLLCPENSVRLPRQEPHVTDCLNRSTSPRVLSGPGAEGARLGLLHSSSVDSPTLGMPALSLPPMSGQILDCSLPLGTQPGSAPHAAPATSSGTLKLHALSLGVGWPSQEGNASRPPL